MTRPCRDRSRGIQGGLVLIAALAGCNPKPTMAVGGVTTVAGLVITVIPDDCDGKLLCFENSEVGAVIAVTGLVIFAIGAIGAGVASAEAPPKQVLHAPPAPFEVTATPPGFDEDGQLLPPPPPVDHRPLPALELDYPSPAQRQMAIQASAAARRHDCRAALASAKELTVETRQRLATVDQDFARCDR